MATNDMTAIATAVGVLHHDRHRPPLSQVSPTAAAIRDADDPVATVEESLLPTWKDLAIAVVAIAAFWATYVAVWILWGGLV